MGLNLGRLSLNQTADFQACFLLAGERPIYIGIAAELDFMADLKRRARSAAGFEVTNQGFSLVGQGRPADVPA